MMLFPHCSTVIRGAPRHVAGAPSYSEGRQESPPSVWYSPEIDASKFTLHILTHTPGGFQWLKYILMMLCNATRRLGDGKHVIRRLRIRGSVTALRAIWNTRVFLKDTRVVADASTVHNSAGMDHCQVRLGCFKAIPILDPVDVEKPYCYCALPHHCIQWHVWSHGWGYVSFGREQDTIERRFLLHWKVARQKLSKYYAEVTPMTSLLVISANILDLFRKLWWFRKWDKAMDINSEDKTSYTPQYQEAFLKYVKNEYCAKDWRMSVIKPENDPHSLIPHYAKDSGFGQSSFDPYDLSSDDEEYWTPKCVAVSIPRSSDCAAHSLTAARLYLNSPPESPKTWGHDNPNLNDYHSDPMEIRSSLWLPVITDLWHQQEEMHSKYSDLSNVAHDIFSIMPQVSRWRPVSPLHKMLLAVESLYTTGKMLRDKAIVRQLIRVDNGILAGDCAASDTGEIGNDLELKKEAEEGKLHRMAKVHNFMEMWQGSQNLRATQKESRAHNKQMIAIGYISDTKEIIKASWSNLQYDCAAEFRMSERSPLRPALSAKDLTGGRTEVSTSSWIRRIDHHPVESGEDSAPESYLDITIWLKWSADLANQNKSEDNCEADNESDVEQGNGIKASESPERSIVSATPIVPGLIQPTQRSMKQAEKWLMTVSAMERRSN